MPKTIAAPEKLPDGLADSPSLTRVNAKAREVDRAKLRVTELLDECNQAVLEAIDEGEAYRDIATAAGRSVGWVQAALESLGVEGPRVRRRPARVKKELAAKKKAAAANGAKK